MCAQHTKIGTRLRSRLLGCVTLLLCSIGLADAATTPNLLPCPSLNNPACERGFPLYFVDVPAGGNTNESLSSSVGGSSPTVVDLDGSGRKHIVVGSNYGVFAYRFDGVFAWVFHTDVPVGTKPAVGDLDGTGEQQVVVTTGSISTENVAASSGRPGAARRKPTSPSTGISSRRSIATSSKCRRIISRTPSSRPSRPLTASS